MVELTLGALATATDLSVLQARVLLTVDRHAPGTLAELGALMEMSAPATSRVVSRLVGAGLMERREATRDRREVVVALTDQGRDALRRLSEARTAALVSPLQSMDLEDRQALSRGLSAFAAVLEAPSR